MLKQLTSVEINRRRKGFAYFPFCAGVIILGLATVPIASVFFNMEAAALLDTGINTGKFFTF